MAGGASRTYVTGSPAYHVDCLPWFMAQPFAILGVDVPCIESARRGPMAPRRPASMLVPLFQRGILLLAPLVNLDQIPGAAWLVDRVLPLNIRGSAVRRAVLCSQKAEKEK